MKIALTIAGSDPSGGAGIQADLKVFRAHRVYGLSAVAAVTAQNSTGVKYVASVEAKMLERQLSVLLSDFEPEAIKTGMLSSAANVLIVAKTARRYGFRNLVMDPVMRSTSGRRLTEKAAESAIREKLLPCCAVITPNLEEASVLADMKIRTEADMERAALRLRDLGAKSVIITGGHLDNVATDLVFDGRFHYFRSKKISGEYHGTGCTFSAAITALLAKGYSVPEAARLAKQFMRRAFEKTFTTGRGMRLFDI